MTNDPLLTNPPITEALVDIRVKLSETITPEKIESIHESIKEEYPKKEEQRISKVQFEPKEEGQVRSTGYKVNGYRFITSDGRQIVQMRLDGFTFSRLHPYISWEQLRKEALRLWTLYKNCVSPEWITRVALRYINNLNIPMPIRDFSDYLTAPPLVPDTLPQSVASFLTRVIIPETSISAIAIITQALEPNVRDTAPIILDIDVFKKYSEGTDDSDVWNTIEQLRIFKNKIFFESITDKLKERYQ